MSNAILARSEAEGCDTCPAGYYCPAGTENFEQWACPMGAYCEQGSTYPTKCPTGTYADVKGLYSRAQCKDCPPGL